jgi:hypothetical protein
MRKLLPADAVAAITPNAADLPERESTLATLEDAQARRRAVRLLYTTAKTGTDAWRQVSVGRVVYGPRTPCGARRGRWHERCSWLRAS